MIAICIIGVDEWIIQGFQTICIKKPSCSDDDNNGSRHFTRNEANVFFPIQPVIYINSQKFDQMMTRFGALLYIGLALEDYNFITTGQVGRFAVL